MKTKILNNSRLYKNFYNTWSAETTIYKNNKTYNILTMKRYSGKLVTTATEIENLKDDSNIQVFTYGNEVHYLTNERLRCTKNKVWEIHIKDLNEFISR